MTRQELFSLWAPQSSPWTPWAMPVVFAQIPEPISVGTLPSSGWSRMVPSAAPSLGAGVSDLPDVPWEIPASDPAMAVVVDLPGEPSVHFGVAAMSKGLRPIPVFASAVGPSEAIVAHPTEGSNPRVAVPMGSLVRAILDATPQLAGTALPTSAPPAFLLDSRRMTTHVPVVAEVFDNRSKIFPEDFPSARFLREHGIARALLVQNRGIEPQEDLAHVLLRWQEGGMEILAVDIRRNDPPAAIRVARPSRYRAFWYRALAMVGLRRNYAGGFGAFEGDWGAGG